MPYFSRGSLRETVVQNGRIIRDVGADSYIQGDEKNNDFLIKGHNNDTPFIITNMKRPTRVTRHRRSTPFYPRRRRKTEKMKKRGGSMRKK